MSKTRPDILPITTDQHRVIVWASTRKRRPPCRRGTRYTPLADDLGKAGYQSNMVGKLHLQANRRRYGMAHGISPNSWLGRPHLFPKSRCTLSGASMAPWTSSANATRPPRFF